jgi:hypothetical protein
MSVAEQSSSHTRADHVHVCSTTLMIDAVLEPPFHSPTREISLNPHYICTSRDEANGSPRFCMSAMAIADQTPHCTRPLDFLHDTDCDSKELEDTEMCKCVPTWLEIFLSLPTLDESFWRQIGTLAGLSWLPGILLQV